MTKAMMKKAVKAIEEYRRDNPTQLVHNCWFRHYGEDYRIEEKHHFGEDGRIETENTFKLFRLCTTSICDTLVEEFAL